MWGKISWARLLWIVTLGLVGSAIYLGGTRFQTRNIPQTSPPKPTSTHSHSSSSEPVQVPNFDPHAAPKAIFRLAQIDTIIPTGNRTEITPYLVQPNDSVFGIAAKFNLRPETILWSNYDLLQDNPHAISVGMELNIPPLDGIYYQWKEGDTFESVANNFKTEADKIINWIGNDLDLTNPHIETGDMVMIPGGKREFQQWLIPTIPRGASGVSAGVYGNGVCSGIYDGLIGSGGFIWPASNHALSGNDYWAGHLAIDIGVYVGEPIWAADHGVVVFAGWATGGYGYVVMLDHGNGYQTLYAHLDSVRVECGQSVLQGQTIATGGSTGKSTGSHLHFEVRYLGGFVNPWFVLP